MKLTTPKNSVWSIATGLGVLGILGKLVNIPFISDYAFVLLAIGFVLLVLACLLKGL